MLADILVDLLSQVPYVRAVCRNKPWTCSMVAWLAAAPVATSHTNVDKLHAAGNEHEISMCCLAADCLQAEQALLDEESGEDAPPGVQLSTEAAMPLKSVFRWVQVNFNGHIQYQLYPAAVVWVKRQAERVASILSCTRNSERQV